MIRKLSAGDRFIISNLFVAFVFFWIIRAIYHFTAIPNEQNIPFLTIIAISFFIINLTLSYFIFKKERGKINFSWEFVLNLALLFLIISTVLSVYTSIVATVAFAGLVIIYASKNKIHFQPHPLFYFLVAYYLIQYIGLIWSLDPQNGFRFVGKGLSFIIVPLAFSFYSISEDEKKKLLRIFFRFLEIYLFMILLAYCYQVYFHKVSFGIGFHLKKNYFCTPVPPGVDYHLLLGWAGYNHPTFVSFILTLMYGVGFYLWKNDHATYFNRISSLEIFFYCIATAIVILLLQSRIGMIMFPIGIFLTLLFNLRKNKKLVISLFIVSVILFSLGSFYVYKNYRSYFMDRPREMQTEIVLSFLKDHYLLGTGTGGMKVLIPWYPTAHNQFLGDLFHLGIPGLLLLLALMGSSFYFAIKDKNFLLLYFLVIYFIMMQIEMPLSLQKGITYYTLFVCLFLNWGKKAITKK